MKRELNRNASHIIEIVMKEANMNQADVARTTGLSEATVCRILKDDDYNPQMSTYRKIQELAQSVLKKAEAQKPEPPPERKEETMDYDAEINELKRRVQKLEGYMLELMAESRRPFEPAPPTSNRGTL